MTIEDLALKWVIWNVDDLSDPGREALEISRRREILVGIGLSRVG